MTNLQTKVIKIIEEVSRVKGLTVDIVINDSGLDSLEVVETLFAIEDKLDVNLDDNDLMKCKTIRDVVNLVEIEKGR